MSGGTVPYHLRQNKAIDRNAFIDFLQNINGIASIKDYTYVSFGGPYMEDFKWIHGTLGLTKMISIENDEDVFARQAFNQPFGFIHCEQKDSSAFIEGSINDETPYIFWLDYANPSQTFEQVDEFGQLIEKLKPMDVVKITLNANPRTLGNPETVKDKLTNEIRRATTDDKNKKRLHTLKSRMGRFLPSGVSEKDITEKELPNTLLRCLQKSANMATKDSNLYCQPCSSFIYRDSEHMMLTLTTIILKKEDKENFKNNVLQKWEIANCNWHSPTMILLPELSIRERLFLDQKIHSIEPEKIAEVLHFLFQKKSNPKEIIDSYSKLYRHLPHFSRVMV
ncbi:O-methyltransferase [Halomonas sp. AOP13-D3-9]